MESGCQNLDLNVKHLLGQLNTARKEISNLRQQIKSLRYIHEKDIDDVRRLLESVTSEALPAVERVTSAEDVKPSTSTDNDVLKLKPIGMISTWFPSKRGTPRQPGICGKVPGKLTLYNSVFTNPDHALEGLQDFSHMWILFHFHRNDSTHIRAKVAPPRLNGTRTGVFSTRSPHRPCPIGLSLVKITRIEDHTIYFEGVDMVDQTPVLDIKPYIPHYDSPLYFEKMSNQSQEANINDSDDYECIEETATLGREEILTTFNSDVDASHGQRSLVLNTYHRESLVKVSQVDVSRDEEIALRLQAEEFQGSANFDAFNMRHMPRVIETNSHNTTAAYDDINTPIAHRTLHLATPQDVPPERRSGLNSSVGHNAHTLDLDAQANLEDMNNRLQNMTVSSQTNPEAPAYTLRNREANYSDTQHTPRNSRLLDGADGPNTVCGTDIDLINRRSLSSRIDNSPVRMGIREAPDGEEGLESQTLTPSQTIYNMQAPRSTTNTSGNDTGEPIPVTSADTRVIENRPTESNTNEVRIPEWISRPRTPLYVAFSERALIQLNEILGSKINDQKMAIENVLREDPRSVYLRQRWGSQFYTFLIHDLHITCRFDDNRGVVTVFQVRHAGRICECGEPEWQCLGHSPVA